MKNEHTILKLTRSEVNKIFSIISRCQEIDPDFDSECFEIKEKFSDLEYDLDKVRLRQYGRSLVGENPEMRYITEDSNQPCVATREDCVVTTKGQRSPAIAIREDSTIKTSGKSSKGVTIGDNSTARSDEDYSPLAILGNESFGESTGAISHVVGTGTKPALSALGENSGCVGLGNGGKYKAGPNGFFAGTWFDNRDNCIRLEVAYVGEDGIKPYTWYSLTWDGQWKELSRNKQIESFKIKGANDRSIDQLQNKSSTILKNAPILYD